MNVIGSFEGQYGFLSNFWPVRIQYQGNSYPSVEHAFHAQKTLDEDERQSIRLARSAGEAKRLGQRVQLRHGWEEMKRRVMYELCKEKFSAKNPQLRASLLATGDAELVEGNFWNDRVWGVCNGTGENALGKILMRVREEIRAEARSDAQTVRRSSSDYAAPGRAEDDDLIPTASAASILASARRAAEEEPFRGAGGESGGGGASGSWDSDSTSSSSSDSGASDSGPSIESSTDAIDP